jgi:hypothetical protein
LSVTVIVSQGLPGGSGGGGTRLQLTAGIANTGPDVVWEKVVATPYDQSQAMMFPGAIDVLPLNVQSSVFPPFVNLHVSVSDGPVTPKLAIATAGLVTDRTAEADAPPYEPLMVVDIAPPTSLVVTPNIALAAPAGTVTLAGTVAGSLADNCTTAPPGGAAAVSVAVPVTGLPPTTLDALSDIEAMATDPVTVSVGDWRLLPLSDAVIAAVPAAMAVTVNVAVDEPGWIVTGVWTVATAGLLLVSVTLAALGGDAMRVTVPCPVAPTTRLGGFNVTPDTARDAVVGELGEVEPPQ